MCDIFDLLKDDIAVKALSNNKAGLCCLTDIEETLIIASSFQQNPREMVVVANNLYTAQQVYNRIYPLLQDDVLLFAMEESLRVEEVAASPSIYANQISVLTELCLNKKPKIVITHPMGVIRYLPSKEIFQNHIIDLAINQEFDMLKLKKLLIENGYKQVNAVDQPLTFALRGGVIDVYSINEDNPIRIEFFDTQIESLRYFNSSTQRTINTIDKCRIVPASTLIYDDDINIVRQEVEQVLQAQKNKANNYARLKDNIDIDMDFIDKHICEHYLYRYQSFYSNRCSLLDYLASPQVVLLNQEAIDNNIEFILEDNNQYIYELFLDDRGLNYYSVFMNFYNLIAKQNTYPISGFSNNNSIKSLIRESYFPLLPLDKAVKELTRLSKEYKIYVSIDKYQIEILNQEFYSQKLDMAEYISFSKQELSQGFNYQDNMFLTAKELFGIKTAKGRYASKFKEAMILDSYQDLKINDYVVHNQYGVGRYEGTITREVNDKKRDYLQVRYRDGDLLLVPLEQFKLVRKFVGSEGVGIQLSKLGSNSWSRTKERISNEVNDIAERLIKLYAAREEEIGYAFSPDDELSQKFEEAFPYQLTVDQKKAIAEVKYDMEQSRPMDRLLCGDVGFGKTEVAMVAAFKACKDLKQIAYLCPTTILSRQHYNSFIERFKGFSIRVALLNRFVPDAEQKEILKDIKAGKIDIIIGTHRILSEDIKFYDLGLLIIDEEQRFGVQAKEKIKELKHTIDVLSLSATPIPRTMQMSLVGVMSLSQLETAPSNRMPIQTYVVEKNESLVRETIQRELARNGQVFYLHNRVSDIYETARKINAMVPQAKIGIGNGQMNREELEEVMYKFVCGDYDVLVCTTIIETGIDIPNVNTIIIEDADHFGLAQLYQIRGRVGRSDRVAYAYLMYANHKQLSEIASKRLQAIKDFTELGSGFKIAMRDLTIRGAGDLLGERQAGFINTVGMSLYLDMLNKAINKQKGINEEVIEENPIKVNDIDGYIPSQFVQVDQEKIGIYQKLDTIKNIEELEEYYNQTVDFYGKLPTSISNLFEKKKIELYLNNKNIERYDQFYQENRLVLTKECSDKVDGVQLFESINQISSSIRLTYLDNRIIFILNKKKGYQIILQKVLEVIRAL